MQPPCLPTSPPPFLQPPTILATALPTTLATAPPPPPDPHTIEDAAHNAAHLFFTSNAARARGEDVDEAEELWDEAMELWDEARAHVHTIHDPGWRSRVEAVLAELPFPSAPPQPL